MTTFPHHTSEGATATLDDQPRPARYALLGNPNTGKTTLFNRLCGLRAKTANFPGSTVEARIGRFRLGQRQCQIVDLPGIYGLHLDRPESLKSRDFIEGDVSLAGKPQAVVIVIDATNLQRNLLLTAQVLRRGLPAVVALNMTDLAARRRLTIDCEKLSDHLGCPVVPISARSGSGVAALCAALDEPRCGTQRLPETDDPRVIAQWSQEVVADAVGELDPSHRRTVETWSDRVDAICTHPILGLGVFSAVMAGLFYTIFSLASLPMDLIELIFAQLGGLGSALLPPGAIRDMVVDGVVPGLAGTLVFIPQICLLFFMISLLEDTGYLARAAFVMDRLLRRFGLPGHSFVPLLSAHACAIPAIMSTRLINDRRSRIATILVAPFLSCSARLPVYVLLVGILFAGNAMLAGLAFTSCYLLGAVAALLTAVLVRRTLLRGPMQPMILELPSYKMPSLRTALLMTLDRAWMFLRKAGTVILAICIVLWWLSAYPKTDPPPQVVALRAQAVQRATAGHPEQAAVLIADAHSIESRNALAKSFAGRLGHAAAPAFEPLGLDWQLTVGVLTSFAAREVFVSTLAVIFAGNEDVEDEQVITRIRSATRDDGSALWTTSTAASLLVFYVLAMQCLPTLPVTAREAGHWGWALLQLGYMTGVAYVAALLTRFMLILFGVP